LKPLFDFTIFMDVPEAELERRLMGRILAHGHDAAYAKHWIASNDMLNVREVQAKSSKADLVV
jgi:pantothenate kinase